MRIIASTSRIAASRMPARGTTAIMPVRNTAGLKLPAEIFADPFSTLP